MFMDSIISDSNSIFKFLKQLDLDLFLSKPQFNHLNQFLNVMIQENYQGKSLPLSIVIGQLLDDF